MTTHALPVHEDHFNIWVHQMRSTTLPQAQGHLAAPVTVDSDVVGYCCLGLGSLLVPDCPVVPVDTGGWDEDHLDTPEYSHQFGEWGAQDLAPIEFVQWLVPDYDTVGNVEFHLAPDWPNPDDMTQGSMRVLPDGAKDPDDIINRWTHGSITAAKMNDDGFTFAQIADVFAYFGIGRVIPSH